MTRKECEAQYNHEQFLKALKRNAVRCYQCNVVRGWPVELVDCREPKNLTLGAWSFPGVWCGRMVVRVAVREDTTLWCGTYGSVPAPSRGKKRPKCAPCRTSSQAALTLMLILSAHSQSAAALLTTPLHMLCRVAAESAHNSSHKSDLL